MASRGAISNRKERKRRLTELYGQQERAAEASDDMLFEDAWASFSVLLVQTIRKHLNYPAQFTRQAAAAVLTHRAMCEKIGIFV